MRYFADRDVPSTADNDRLATWASPSASETSTRPAWKSESRASRIAVSTRAPTDAGAE